MDVLMAQWNGSVGNLLRSYAFLSAAYHYFIMLSHINKQYAVPQWLEGLQAASSLPFNVGTVKKNKRSKDLGALLDTCSWYDKWQFSADLLY